MVTGMVHFHFQDAGKQQLAQFAKTLLEIHLYGFRSIVILPGHGPQPATCRKAEEVYRQNVGRRSSFDLDSLLEQV